MGSDLERRGDLINEEKLASLIGSYGASLGSCSKQPSRIKHSAARRRFLLSGVAGLCLLIAAFSLWPRDAVAASLKRIGLAIQRAKTMQVVTEVEKANGWKPIVRTFYKDGKWRIVSRIGSNMEATTVLVGRQVLMDHTKLSHATLEVADPAYIDEAKTDSMSAIDFAKRNLDFGNVSIERTATLGKHAPVNGRETYSVIMVRSDDNYRAEIVVDKQTDLPISTDMRVSYPDYTQHSREKYRFDDPLDDSMFDLKSKKPIVDIPAEQAKLAEKWEKPLGQIGTTAVRDACVTSDGTVWLVISNPAIVGDVPQPVSIGKDYTRARSVHPSNILNKERFQLNGDMILVAGFVPLDPARRPPADVDVDFANSTLSSDEVVEDAPVVGSLSLHPRVLSSDRPDYFTALDLDHFGFQLHLNLWGSRANALEKLGRLLDAAEAHERTAVEYRNFVPYGGRFHLEKAAKCYRQLGMTAEADRAAQEAKDLIQEHKSMQGH